jgi:hypothetical protein
MKFKISWLLTIFYIANTIVAEATSAAYELTLFAYIYSQLDTAGQTNMLTTYIDLNGKGLTPANLANLINELTRPSPNVASTIGTSIFGTGTTTTPMTVEDISTDINSYITTLPKNQKSNVQIKVGNVFPSIQANPELGTNAKLFANVYAQLTSLSNAVIRGNPATNANVNFLNKNVNNARTKVINTIAQDMSESTNANVKSLYTAITEYINVHENPIAVVNSGTDNADDLISAYNNAVDQWRAQNFFPAVGPNIDRVNPKVDLNHIGIVSAANDLSWELIEPLC